LSKEERRNKKTTQRRGIKMDQKDKGNYFQVKNIKNQSFKK